MTSIDRPESVQRLEETPAFATEHLAPRTVDVPLPGVSLTNIKLEHVRDTLQVLCVTKKHSSVSSSGKEKKGAYASGNTSTKVLKRDIKLLRGDDPDRAAIASLSNGIVKVEIGQKVKR